MISAIFKTLWFWLYLFDYGNFGMVVDELGEVLVWQELCVIVPRSIYLIRPHLQVYNRAHRVLIIADIISRY